MAAPCITGSGVGRAAITGRCFAATGSRTVFSVSVFHQGRTTRGFIL